MLKSTVTVTVLKPFEYQGKGYTAGQPITLSPVDAIVMSRKRFVTLSKRKAMVPEPVVEVVPEPEPPKARRTYKRRDMQAEHTTTLEPEPEVMSEPDAVPEPFVADSEPDPAA